MIRRRPMERVGDLLPEMARRLGLEAELRQAQAAASWTALVAELVPPAAGATRLLRIDGERAVVEADAPIVAQELRLRSVDLLASLRTRPGGRGVTELVVRVRPPGRL
ncbi:MAG TPA: DciA family protein [Candidatus Binatia bacterium]|nr:DciA family protein [Candidatus Binatia bacterium]